MREATPAEWAEYLRQVELQFRLIDQLRPEFKRIVWELGFDPIRVRQMLAQQRREARLGGSPESTRAASRRAL